MKPGILKRQSTVSDGPGDRAGMWFIVSIPKPPDTIDVSLSESTNDDSIDESVSMRRALEECLEKCGVQNVVWCDTSDGKFCQVCFPCESGEPTDHVLEIFAEHGIGVRNHSVVGVLPCAVFYMPVENRVASPTSQEEKGNLDAAQAESNEKKRVARSVQRKFLKSVTARLTVAQVVAGVKAQGELTFDFVAFVLLAGMIAALGLMDNNVVSIIAAMLVSPLMGPIMAITFGINIRDTSLLKTGFRTELIGLFLCLIFGFIFGLINAFWGDIPAYEGASWSPELWPNAEMTSRGQWRSLWVGALVALPSGGGVAMAILGGNSACLVGVAISASLLPPIINCGILWSLSVVKIMKAQTQDWIQVNRTGVLIEVPQAYMSPPGFEATYFDNYSMHKECAILGVVSFCLTVVNIICIIVAGTAVLKIKEIAPSASLQNTKRFWKHDIKVARDYNKTLGGNSATRMGKDLLDEWTRIQQRSTGSLDDLTTILNEAQDDDVYKTVVNQLANHPPVNVARFLSRTLSVPSRSNTVAPRSAVDSRMNVWEVESLLHQGDDSYTGGKIAPDTQQQQQHRRRSFSDSHPDILAKDSPSRRQSKPRFFHFRPNTRFQVARIFEDGNTSASGDVSGSAHAQEPLLRRMQRRFTRSGSAVQTPTRGEPPV